MRVVFIEDVEGVALGGEVKEVKNGFARNYLIPKKLAAPATHNNLQRIHKFSKDAAVSRAQKFDDMKELAETLEGTEITIEMRAGANNRLYGSVTGTMVADALAEETGVPIERRLVQLDDPIREVGIYEIPIRLYTDVNASIKLTVYATGTDPFEMVQEEEEDQEQETSSGDDVVPEEDVENTETVDSNEHTIEPTNSEEDNTIGEDSEETPQG
ncbi:50S ribosomal protein L9 [Chloroflexi bacterium]|nr:50S ribosomal protein L9 [Chloroflexota bacterium]